MWATGQNLCPCPPHGYSLHEIHERSQPSIPVRAGQISVHTGPMNKIEGAGANDRSIYLSVSFGSSLWRSPD
jgi:hypothetical protein